MTFEQILETAAYGGIPHNDARIRCARAVYDAILQAATRDGSAGHSDIEQYVLSVLPSVYYMDPPDGGIVSVLEQLRRMADDAAKYRAMKKSK